MLNVMVQDKYTNHQYQTLSDAGKRRAYDDRLAAPAQVTEGPHFTWTNIASTEASVAMAEEERRERRTELDEMYDAFFGKSSPAYHCRKLAPCLLS